MRAEKILSTTSARLDLAAGVKGGRLAIYVLWQNLSTLWE
jgi:hypothetical protein